LEDKLHPLQWKTVHKTYKII